MLVTARSLSLFGPQVFSPFEEAEYLEAGRAWTAGARP